MGVTMKLKTLKDIGTLYLVPKEELKQLAIKWVKDKEKFRWFPYAREFFIEFHNITEEDLK